MIYLSGDIHGDLIRLISDIRRYGITENDIVVLLGDVGLNYSCDERERINKEAVNRLGITIFCIHGNHERRPETIPSYHETQWHGGTVYVEDEFPNLLFAKDGELFDLEGYTALVIGGAYSVDKPYRLQKGWRWFDDEQPSDDIKHRVENKIDSCGRIVDVVLSHTCPAKYTPTEAFMKNLDQSTVDRSTEEWLDKIEENLYYGYWFCGHWHIDKRIDKMHFLMHSYETLPELKTYEFTVDAQLKADFEELCRNIGTTPDLAARAFFRFAADKRNHNTIKRWAEGCKAEE